jgi:hypothetical protein
MELTTGAILRRITETPLSTSAHKLATIILDGIAWKDGYNGLERGTAAFTLAHLAEKMGVSRQHLTALLVELAASSLALVRWKPNGKFAPWLFRFGGNADADAPPDVVSATSDTSLSRDSRSKTIFAGRIEIGAGTNVYRAPWAKATLPCWNVDTQAIWKRFVALNRARGNAAVPAGLHAAVADFAGCCCETKSSCVTEAVIDAGRTGTASTYCRCTQQELAVSRIGSAQVDGTTRL